MIRTQDAGTRTVALQSKPGLRASTNQCRAEDRPWRAERGPEGWVPVLAEQECSGQDRTLLGLEFKRSQDLPGLFRFCLYLDIVQPMFLQHC